MVDQARAWGWQEQLEQGDPFQHRLFMKPGVGRTLHVYIEGDGTAWLQRRVVAPDPSPREPQLLALMQRDTAPALYLGRPCYLQVDDPLCHPLLWTMGRYSEPVLQSLVHVVKRHQQPGQPLLLIGFSGGGTLAVLLASRLSNVKGVVTLAANLDTEAWAQAHGYTPLMLSLNPNTQLPLADTIAQWHFIGREDRNIPRAAWRDFVGRQAGAQWSEIPGLGHTGWETQTERLLPYLHAFE